MYNTQPITDDLAICIGLQDLQFLYKKSHRCERFGMPGNEKAFDITSDHAESFLFKTEDERYLDLLRFGPDIINHITLYYYSRYPVLQALFSAVYEKKSQKIRF